MKVLVDCYELVRGRGSSTGIYNYAVQLTRALGRVPEARAIDWLVLANRRNARELRAAGSVRLAVLDDGPRGKPGKVLWDLGRAAEVIRPLGVDVYWSPRGFAPLGVARAVHHLAITVHDLIPLYYGAFAGSVVARLENAYVTARLLRSIRVAELVLTVSHASAHELARRTGRTRGVEVVPNGVRASHAPPARQRTHLLAVTSARRHKNLENLVRGYACYVREAGARALPLVVCGATQADCARWSEDARALGGLRCVTGIDDVALDHLYAACAAFISVSRLEGFGLPPLEALQAGAPVIASDIPAHREVLGASCRFVDPEDAPALGRAIGEVVSMGAGASARAAAEAVLRAHTWERAARRVAAVVEALRGPAEVRHAA